MHFLWIAPLSYCLTQKNNIKLISGVSELSWHLWSWRSAKIVQVKDLSFEVSSHIVSEVQMMNFLTVQASREKVERFLPEWKSRKISLPATWGEQKSISMNPFSIEPFSIISPLKICWHQKMKSSVRKVFSNFNFCKCLLFRFFMSCFLTYLPLATSKFSFLCDLR